MMAGINEDIFCCLPALSDEYNAELSLKIHWADNQNVPTAQRVTLTKWQFWDVKVTAIIASQV